MNANLKTKVRVAMAILDYNQSHFAAHVGLSTAGFNKIYNNKIRPLKRTLASIEAATDLIIKGYINA